VLAPATGMCGPEKDRSLSRPSGLLVMTIFVSPKKQKWEELQNLSQ